MSLPFLLEIGTEEIPDWMIPPALENLRELFLDLLAKNGVGQGVTVRIDATPRRLLLHADRIPERQNDAEELVSGPPKAAPQNASAIPAMVRRESRRPNSPLRAEPISGSIGISQRCKFGVIA